MRLFNFFTNLFHLAENPIENKAVLSMINKMNELEGLQFSITVDTEGWIAECKNLQGIITGGTNPNPPLAEIDSEIKDAIFSAFSIPTYLCDANLIKSPFDLEATSYSIEQIPLVYTTGRFQFAQ